MQRAAKHLACGSNQNRCTDWFSAAREMPRGALHDRPLLYRYFGTSLFNHAATPSSSRTFSINWRVLKGLEIYKSAPTS